MNEKNLKKKLMSELITQWKNGAHYSTLRELIRNYAEEIHPKLSSYGYSSRLIPEEWDNLILSLLVKTERTIEKEFHEIIYSTLKAKYERSRNETPRLMTNSEIEDDISKNGCFIDVKIRLYELLDVWDIEDEELAILEDQKIDLGKFMNDKQNVHTRVVNRQTNTIMNELANVKVKKNQRTLDEITECWRGKYLAEDFRKVIQDMTFWGNKSEIEKEDDWAYRIALRALWAKIKTYDGERRTELEKRLFEECLDSVGVCAHGHMTRLANVLVGFDATIVVVKSESLQDRMAAISLLDLDTEVKIAQATKVMDEMQIPQIERSAWLEAF
jgi:hypothetical protein